MSTKRIRDNDDCLQLREKINALWPTFTRTEQARVKKLVKVEQQRDEVFGPVCCIFASKCDYPHDIVLSLALKQSDLIRTTFKHAAQAPPKSWAHSWYSKFYTAFLGACVDDDACVRDVTMFQQLLTKYNELFYYTPIYRHPADDYGRERCLGNIAAVCSAATATIRCDAAYRLMETGNAQLDKRRPFMEFVHQLLPAEVQGGIESNLTRMDGVSNTNAVALFISWGIGGDVLARQYKLMSAFVEDGIDITFRPFDFHLLVLPPSDVLKGIQLDEVYVVFVQLFGHIEVPCPKFIAALVDAVEPEVLREGMKLYFDSDNAKHVDFGSPRCVEIRQFFLNAGVFTPSVDTRAVERPIPLLTCDLHADGSPLNIMMLNTYYDVPPRQEEASRGPSFPFLALE